MMKMVSLVIASILVLTCYGATCPPNLQFSQKQARQGTSNLGGFEGRSVSWICGGSCQVSPTTGGSFLWDGKTVRTVGEGFYDILCQETCDGKASSCSFQVAVGKSGSSFVQGDPFTPTVYDIDRVKMYKCPLVAPTVYKATKRDSNGYFFWDPAVEFPQMYASVLYSTYAIECEPMVCVVKDATTQALLDTVVSPNPITLKAPKVEVSCSVLCGCKGGIHTGPDCYYFNVVPYSKMSQCPPFQVQES
jgi:hypothetical protein